MCNMWHLEYIGVNLLPLITSVQHGLWAEFFLDFNILSVSHILGDHKRVKRNWSGTDYMMFLIAPPPHTKPVGENSIRTRKHRISQFKKKNKLWAHLLPVTYFPCGMSLGFLCDSTLDKVLPGFCS